MLTALGNEEKLTFQELSKRQTFLANDFIFLGETTFQSCPPKPAVNWASSVVQSPFLAYLNSDLHTRPSSAARWSTAIASGLAPHLHVLLGLMPWKPRPSRLLETSTMKPSLWAGHFAITDRPVISLVFYYILSGLAPSALSVL